MPPPNWHLKQLGVELNFPGKKSAPRDAVSRHVVLLSDGSIVSCRSQKRKNISIGATVHLIQQLSDQGMRTFDRREDRRNYYYYYYHLTASFPGQPG